MGAFPQVAAIYERRVRFRPAARRSRRGEASSRRKATSAVENDWGPSKGHDLGLRPTVSSETFGARTFIASTKKSKRSLPQKTARRCSGALDDLRCHRACARVVAGLHHFLGDQMSRFLLIATAAAALSFGVATDAGAEPVSLACSYSQGGQPQMFFSIDVATGIVVTDYGTFQATVTPTAVSWTVPYKDLGGGAYRSTTHYTFDRVSGVLSWDSDGVAVAFCQRGARPQPVLP